MKTTYDQSFNPDFPRSFSRELVSSGDPYTLFKHSVCSKISKGKDIPVEELVIIDHMKEKSESSSFPYQLKVEKFGS